MANRIPTYYLCEICQQMDPDMYSHFGMQTVVKEYKDKRDSDEEYSIEEITCKLVGTIFGALVEGGLQPVELHCAIHNADTISDYDIMTGQTTVEPKADHFHCMCKFRERVKLTDVAQAVGVLGQYVNKPSTRGKYAWANMVGYLIHASDEDKYQYSPSNVASWGVEGEYRQYEDYVEEYGKYWSNQRLSRKYITNKLNINTLLAAIDNRQIRTTREIMENDELFSIYLENQEKIDKRIKVWEEKDTIKALHNIESGEVVKQIIYVWGEPGSGKTTLTHEIAEQKQAEIEEKEGVKPKISVATSSHPMEDLKGAGAGGIVIFDDVSSDCMSRDDWLCLLSSNPKEVERSFGARYKNTMVCPYVIIVSNVTGPYPYFSRILNGNKEDTVDQFIRRICFMIEVVYQGETINRKYNLYLPAYSVPNVPLFTNENGQMVFGKFFLEEQANYADKDSLLEDVGKIMDGTIKPEDIRTEEINGKKSVPPKRKAINEGLKGHQKELDIVAEFGGQPVKNKS